MKVCVTGAAGFIGSNLAEALLRKGWEVVGVDNFNDYYSPERKRKNAGLLSRYPNYTPVELDIRDRDSVFAAFRKHRPRVVAHLAGMGGVRNSVEHPELYLAVNTVGALNVMDAGRAVDIGNFVFASTSSIYGDSAEIPFNEEAPCVTPPQPYAASKRAIELMGYTYHKLHGFSFTATRFFTVYGPRGRPDMMPYLVADSIATGRKIPFYGEAMQRDWTFVGDIVAGLELALSKPLGYEIINLGRGNPTKLVDLIAAMEALAGRPANLELAPKPEADVWVTFADISKAQRLLGYAPKVSMLEGVEMFWRWYEEEVARYQ